VDDVWATYADFGNVQRWSPVVAKSNLTSQVTEGVGVARHCELVPRGAIDEVVSGWTPGEKMVIEVEPAGPIAAQQVTIDFASSESASSVRMSMQVTLQPGAEERADAIAESLRGVIQSTLAGLCHYLETGGLVDETTSLSTVSVHE
jgi:hypothetical protein